MPIISTDVARQHCKADEADDVLLAVYISAAQRRAEMMLNRAIYDTAEELSVAQDTAATQAGPALQAYLLAMDEARDTYDAAIEAANEIADDSERAIALLTAEAAYARATTSLTANFDAGANSRELIVYGIVATEDIKAALLLTIGHLFRNREDVVTGQSAPAVELPNAASALLWPYTRIRGF